MDLDDESIAAARDRGQAHRRHERRDAGAVAGIDDDGQVSSLLQVRDRCEWQSEPRVRLERADAAFSEHDLLVALIEDVFRRQQKLFDGG